MQPSGLRTHVFRSIVPAALLTELPADISLARDTKLLPKTSSTRHLLQKPRKIRYFQAKILIKNLCLKSDNSDFMTEHWSTISSRFENTFISLSSGQLSYADDLNKENHGQQNDSSYSKEIQFIHGYAMHEREFDSNTMRGVDIEINRSESTD